jgi:hypothetical protein
MSVAQVLKYDNRKMHDWISIKKTTGGNECRQKCSILYVFYGRTTLKCKRSQINLSTFSMHFYRRTRKWINVILLKLKITFLSLDAFLLRIGAKITSTFNTALLAQTHTHITHTHACSQKSIAFYCIHKMSLLVTNETGLTSKCSELCEFQAVKSLI